MNLADAAEAILREHRGSPLHSKDIATEAIEKGLISPQSKTPWVYVAAAIRKDTRRRRQQGEKARFTSDGNGRYSLQ